MSINLKRYFKLNSSIRNDNIKSLKNIFSFEKNLTLIKLDIKSFYDNIPHESLMLQIAKNRILNKEDLKLLKNYLKSNPHITSGVHQGTEISNILADIYMKSLDELIISLHPSTIFAKRYVDDIFIVFNKTLNGNEVASILKCLTQHIELKGLEFNTSKTEILSISIDTKKNHNYLDITTNETTFKKCRNINYSIYTYSIDKNNNLHKHYKKNATITYLGYRFSWKIIDDNVSFKIDISPKKLNKYRTRLYKMFLIFEKSIKKNNSQIHYNILRERISLFCSTYVLISNSSSKDSLVIGLSENYKYIHPYNEQIKSLVKLLKDKIFYIYKQKIINDDQLYELMGIVIKYKSYVDLYNLDINDFLVLVQSVYTTKISLSKFTNNYHKKKHLTYLYMNAIKIS